MGRPKALRCCYWLAVESKMQTRVSLTWHWTSRQGPPDTNPSYFEGCQFSDVPRRPGAGLF